MLRKIKKSAKNLVNVRGIALAGMLLALYAVLGLYKIPIPPSGLENRLSLTFLATGAAGIILGPIPAAVIGALGDIFGYLLNPGGGAYFPGFTLSAALGGFVYGIFLYEEKFDKKQILRIAIAVIFITFFINILLNTYWINIMYKKASAVFASARIIKNLVTLPVHIILLSLLNSTLEAAGLRKKYENTVFR